MKLLLLLASLSWGYVPVATSTDSQVEVDQNFMDMAREIQRTNLTDGGEIKQHVKISSSVQLSSDGITFSDGTKQTTAVTSGGPEAFVTFTGTGTVTIQGTAVNVSSITDLGTGSYQVNFDADLDTQHPGCVCTAAPIRVCHGGALVNDGSSWKLQTQDTSFSNADADYVTVSCWGNQ